MTAILDEPVYRIPPFRINEIFAAPPRAWDVDATNIPSQWVKTEGEYTRIAIIDTGVDATHPAIKDRIAQAYDFTGSRFSYRDKNGHGTHCTDRARQFAPLATFYCYKGLGDDGSGTTQGLVGSLRQARKDRCHVASCSWGSRFDDPRLRDEVLQCIADGMTIFFAAGNDGGPVNFPAVYGIPVTALDRNFKIAPFSSRGKEVIVGAPGVDIVAAIPQDMGGYASMSGTSMACPGVVGIYALGRTFNEAMFKNQAATINTIKSYAKDAGSPGFDPLYGYGIIDPATILVPEEAPPPVTTPPVTSPVTKTMQTRVNGYLITTTVEQVTA